MKIKNKSCEVTLMTIEAIGTIVGLVSIVVGIIIGMVKILLEQILSVKEALEELKDNDQSLSYEIRQSSVSTNSLKNTIELLNRETEESNQKITQTLKYQVAITLRVIRSIGNIESYLVKNTDYEKISEENIDVDTYFEKVWHSNIN